VITMFSYYDVIVSFYDVITMFLYHFTM